MERKISAVFPAASAVGILLGVCVPGCLITAFRLPVSETWQLLGFCALTAVLWSGLFCLKQGGRLFVCAGILALAWLWRRETLPEQLWYLLTHITELYDRAYGWGVPILPETAAVVTDLPLIITGSLAAAAGAWCICRQGSTWLPAAGALIPLSLCVVVTDTVPREGYLFGVLLALTLLLIAGNLRRENSVQSIRLMVLAAVPAALALGLLFLAVPRKGYADPGRELREAVLREAMALPERLEEQAEALADRLRTREPQQVDLAQLGPRGSFDYAVMEVTSDTGGILYLRGQDYDDYTGFDWQSGQDREEVFGLKPEAAGSVTVRTVGEKTQYYLPYYPAEEVTLTGGAGANPEGKREYTVRLAQLPEDWRLRAYTPAQAGPALPEGMERYLTLPESTRAGLAEILGTLALTGSATETADRIAAFVTDRGSYDTDTLPMPQEEGDFALWFLEKAQTGYCVHYATAAAVLLRGAGVPARYVTGYMLQTRPGQTVRVTPEDAHAWAEYYEPLLGVWIPLEATPAASSPTAVTEETVGPSTVPVTQEIPETEAPEMTEMPEKTPGPAAPTETLPEPEGETRERDGFGQALKTGLACIPALLLLALQRSVRLKLRRRRMYTGNGNRQALERWREAERLARLLKESPTEELLVLAQKAKFSQHRLTGQELALFDSYHRSCLRRLKQRPGYLRLVYQYIYAAW